MIASCDVAQVQKWGVDPEISVQLFQFAWSPVLIIRFTKRLEKLQK